MNNNQKKYDLIIKCGEDVKSFGFISCESEGKAKETKSYKDILKVAECCKFKNSMIDRCCQVQLIDVSSDEYLTGLETPCGSTSKDAISVQGKQANNETSLGIIVIAALLFIAVLIGMFFDGYNDALVYMTVVITWAVFSFNSLSKHFGEKVDKIKTLLSFSLMLSAFYKLGAFSSLF